MVEWAVDRRSRRQPRRAAIDAGADRSPSPAGGAETGPRPPLTTSELQGLAEQLDRLLAAVLDGQMSTTAATTHRLEGAVAALDAVLGRRSWLLGETG